MSERIVLPKQVRGDLSRAVGSVWYRVIGHGDFIRSVRTSVRDVEMTWGRMNIPYRLVAYNEHSCVYWLVTDGVGYLIELTVTM